MRIAPRPDPLPQTPLRRGVPPLDWDARTRRRMCLGWALFAGTCGFVLGWWGR